MPLNVVSLLFASMLITKNTKFLMQLFLALMLNGNI